MMSPGAQEEKNNVQKVEKKNNILPLSGNERTMNLNPLILTNIQSSHYFKVNLYELKTYHEVIDEIYYKVTHLEPWEKGSRKTAGQTGMCGGEEEEYQIALFLQLIHHAWQEVRGVGAGGIVSTAFCLLYKLFTLKLTRKQVNGLITHPDSPYIRALGFMYIRFTQPPADLWDWYDEYLEDPEELDVKAGGGQVMCIGDMLRHFLSKLDWFSTLFPRIPVPIQQGLEKKLSARFPNPLGTVNRSTKSATPGAVGPPAAAPLPAEHHSGGSGRGTKEARHIPDDEVSFGEAERVSSRMRRSTSPTNGSSRVDKKERERDRERRDDAHRSSERHRSPESYRGSDRHRSQERHRSLDRHRSPERHNSRGRERDVEKIRDRSRDRGRGKDERWKGRGEGRETGREKSRWHRDKDSSKHSHGRYGKDFSEDLMRERERQRKDDKCRDEDRKRNSRS